MNDVVVVTVNDSWNDLPNYLRSQLLREHSAIDNLIEKLTSLTELSDQVEVIRILVIFK